MKKIGKEKRIALIAHDNMKDEMVEWARANRDILKNHILLGTGTTASLVANRVHLEVEKLKSGPYGGDLQIGVRIAEGLVDLVIFFHDPLMTQPHDPDIKALMRLATLYDIPIATNRSTADFIMTSKYINEEFFTKEIDFTAYNQKRTDEFKNIR